MNCQRCSKLVMKKGKAYANNENVCFCMNINHIREKQIELAGVNFVEKNRSQLSDDTFELGYGFQEGARWADLIPKSLIESNKICTWEIVPYESKGHSLSPDDFDRIIKRLEAIEKKLDSK